MGYGFVQYLTAEAAQKALRQLQVMSMFPLWNSLSFSLQPGSWLMCVCCLNPQPALHCGRSPVRAEDFRESHEVNNHQRSLSERDDKQKWSSINKVCFLCSCMSIKHQRWIVTCQIPCRKQTLKLQILVLLSAKMCMKIFLIFINSECSLCGRIYLYMCHHYIFSSFSPLRRTAEVSRKKKQVEKKQTGSKILVRNVPFQATVREIRELFW